MIARLTGKVALISGAARGIGAAIARRFIAEGACTIIGDVLEAEGSELARDLGTNAAFTRLDVTQRGDWDAAVALAEARFGKLDCLVNNAGIIVFKALDDLTEDEMRRIMDVNAMGTMIGTQAVLAALGRAGGGSIVNMSSADGLAGANALTAYCASKFAVRGFTRACAMELGPRGIRVNSIHPGGIVSAMTNPASRPREELDRGFRIYPAQRAGDPEDIAAAAAFLASDDAAYCHGTELSVDGGLNAGHYYTMLPGAPSP